MGLGVALGGLLAAEPLKSVPLAVASQPGPNDFPWPTKGPVVILAPHPDDEVLGAGGLMQEAVARGIPVKVILITAGDGFPADTAFLYRSLRPTPADFLAVGRRRYQESLAAISHLGLKPKDVRLLGLPDSGTGLLWRRPWSRTLTDRHTGSQTVPYETAWRPGAPFSGDSEIDLLKAALVEEPPGLLVLPHPNDVHPDHWATTAFATVALAELAAAGVDWAGNLPQLTYLVHWGGWPPPWPRPFGFYPSVPLGLPKEVLNNETAWQFQPLGPGAIQRKEEAILRYRTQVVLIGTFLEAFARPAEPFGRPLLGRPGLFTGRWDQLPVVLHGYSNHDRLWSFPAEISLGRDDRHLFFLVRWNQPDPRSGLNLAFSMWGPRERRNITLTAAGVRGPLFTEIQRSADRWTFTLPLELLGGRQDFVLGAESFLAGRSTGFTAQRYFKL